MLNWIARSGVTVEGESREFSQKLTLPDVLGEWRVVEASGWDQVLRQFSLHDPLQDQLIEGAENRGCSVLGIAFCPCGIVLEGCNLSLELLVELFQLIFLTEDILTLEHHLFLLTIGHCCCFFICFFIS